MALPFVKWAGGKRQLLPKINEKKPNSFKNYYEPFVGGGAVFFDLVPGNAVINDINESLINAYRQIKDSPETVYEHIAVLDEIPEDVKAYYYLQRERYNEKLSSATYDAETAALLIFINKHCFNGLYRVNAKGMFNVPCNGSRRQSATLEQLKSVSDALRNVEIKCGDFETICDMASKDDFVFIDSPYVPLNPTSFESYTKEGFDYDNHVRLSRAFREMDSRGCKLMLTNHNTDLINELYDGYNKEVVQVQRMINSDASNRKGEEIIITNYE